MEFNRAGLDVWTEESTFDVTRERLAAYAAATNDPIPAHRAGDVASPVFAIVPVFQTLLEPALEVVPLHLIGRIVHGEQDFHFHRPIRPGDRLTSRGKMTGWAGLDNGTAATVRLETRDDGGDLVNEQDVTFFVRGFNAGTAGTAPAPHKFDESLRTTEPVTEVEAKVDPDQTHRYAPAAGDPMPIHLDEDIAKQAGLPGIIAHGLCTMAFTSWAILTTQANSDTTRLRRLAVRFAKPVLPGQSLTTRIWRSGTAYTYETTVGDTVVIKDGLAEID